VVPEVEQVKTRIIDPNFPTIAENMFEILIVALGIGLLFACIGLCYW
jgi:hypothetical protein